MSGRAAPPPAQHAGEVICLDSDEEAGPSRQPAPKPRRSGSGALRPGRRRTAPAASPAGNARTSGGPRRPAANAGASHVVVDLTQGSPEDDMLVTRAEPAGKRARLLPLPFSAPQAPPPLAKPDAKCAICLEPMVQMACGPCGHVFCDACLKASVKASRRCPTCRKALQPRQIHRIYLD